MRTILRALDGSMIGERSLVLEYVCRLVSFLVYLIVRGVGDIMFGHIFIR